MACEQLVVVEILNGCSLSSDTGLSHHLYINISSYNIIYHTCVHTDVCMYLNYICMHACMYVRTYVCMHVYCMYVSYV